MDRPKTVADAVIRDSGFWLPDDCVVKLTAIELGALYGCLLEVKRTGGSLTAQISKRGPNGETDTVRISLIDRLLEKVEEARKQSEEDAYRRLSELSQDPVI
jgi:hypothetical protein